MEVQAELEMNKQLTCRLCMVVLYGCSISIYSTAVLFLLQIAVLVSAAMLVHSSPVKSQKGLADDAIL